MAEIRVKTQEEKIQQAYEDAVAVMRAVDNVTGGGTIPKSALSADDKRRLEGLKQLWRRHPRAVREAAWAIFQKEVNRVSGIEQLGTVPAAGGDGGAATDNTGDAGDGSAASGTADGAQQPKAKRTRRSGGSLGGDDGGLLGNTERDTKSGARRRVSSDTKPAGGAC